MVFARALLDFKLSGLIRFFDVVSRWNKLTRKKGCCGAFFKRPLLIIAGRAKEIMVRRTWGVWRHKPRRGGKDIRGSFDFGMSDLALLLHATRFMFFLDTSHIIDNIFDHEAGLWLPYSAQRPRGIVFYMFTGFIVGDLWHSNVFSCNNIIFTKAWNHLQLLLTSQPLTLRPLAKPSS